MKIPKRSARDFLEADEVLSLLVAGEVFDNPVRPDTARAADEVRQLRDHEHLTWKQIAARMERSEAGVIWLYGRRAVRCPSASRAVIALLAASGARNTEACDVRWSDLDFTHGKIYVSRSKTKRGVREIDMIPWLREELLSYRAAVGTPELATSFGLSCERRTLRGTSAGCRPSPSPSRPTHSAGRTSR